MDQMNCPSCQTEMKPGRVSVHGTAVGLAAVGLSHQHCWFEEFARDAGEQIVVESNGRRSGYRCPECQTLVIVTEDLDDKGFPAYLEIQEEPET